jgi:hypothetical protein
VPTMTVCDFCGHRGPRAKEHIWSAWLLREFGLETSTMDNTHIALAGGAVSKRVQSASSMRYGRVCSTCNNGWMSELESDVKPILMELISSIDSKDKLVEDEANVLALWAFKTAIVRNAGTNYRSIVPKEHYRYLYEVRKIPPGVYIDLGLCPSHSSLSALQSQTLLGFLLPEDASATTKLQQHLYNITLAVGPLLLRTIHFPHQSYAVLASPSFESGTQRLYPSAGCSLKFTQHCQHPSDFESEAYFVASNRSNDDSNIE